MHRKIKMHLKMVLLRTMPYPNSLRATSIVKIPETSASGLNFLDPLPFSLKKGPTNENVGIL